MVEILPVSLVNVFVVSKWVTSTEKNGKVVCMLLLLMIASIGDLIFIMWKL